MISTSPLATVEALGASVADGVVKEKVGKLGLGEKSCHLGVVVRADADVESKTVSEREGEGLRAECEVVRQRNEFEDSTGVLEAERRAVALGKRFGY